VLTIVVAYAGVQVEARGDPAAIPLLARGIERMVIITKVDIPRGKKERSHVL
jgi:hypothetical protein